MCDFSKQSNVTLFEHVYTGLTGIIPNIGFFVQITAGCKNKAYSLIHFYVLTYLRNKF